MSTSRGARRPPRPPRPTRGAMRSGCARRRRRAGGRLRRRSRARAATGRVRPRSARTTGCARRERLDQRADHLGVVTPGWSAMRITAASLSSSSAWIAAASDAWPSLNGVVDDPALRREPERRSTSGVVAGHDDDLVDTGDASASIACCASGFPCATPSASSRRTAIRRRPRARPPRSRTPSARPKSLRKKFA